MPPPMEGKPLSAETALITANRVLGQAAPLAATDTDIYTVPTKTSALVRAILVANRGAGAAKIRIAVSPAGAALANPHYIAFDKSVGIADVYSVPIQEPLPLEAATVIRVRSDTADVSFGVYGYEIRQPGA